MTSEQFLENKRNKITIDYIDNKFVAKLYKGSKLHCTADATTLTGLDDAITTALKVITVNAILSGWVQGIIEIKVSVIFEVTKDLRIEKVTASPDIRLFCIGKKLNELVIPMGWDLHILHDNHLIDYNNIQFMYVTETLEFEIEKYSNTDE